MASNVLFTYNSSAIHSLKKTDRPCLIPFLGNGHQILAQITRNRNRDHHFHQLSRKFTIYATTKGSAEPSESEEAMPSWAKPGTNEPPPWAREEGKSDGSKAGFEAPFFVYLLASAVAAIAAIGSIFEYSNQRPAFGVINSDSIFYAPLLGFFTFVGLPASVFLWFKSVQVANKEAEEQDRRDGYLK